MPYSAMSKRIELALVLALGAVIAAASGCASAPAEAEATAEPRVSRPARRSNVVITQQELRESAARDAYQAVQMLRPDWLRGRGASTLAGAPPDIVVYLDGQRLGNKNMLAQLTTNGIKEVRFYNAGDATQRWGTGHSAGVIEVLTR